MNRQIEPVLVKEDAVVLTAHYPDLSINEQLIKDAHEQGWRKINVSAVQVKHMSKWWVETPAVNTIVDWVANTIAQSNPFVNTHKFTVVSTWFAKYSKGDKSISHHHFPAQYSFVYYVKTPPGSTPLTLTTSNTNIPVEAGKVVILPCGLMHHVDPCECDDRIVLAGNFYLTPPNMEVSMEGFYAGGYEWDD